MGLLFESLGLLASSEVVSCSASDFVTGYANQAAGKTREIFEKAVGGVLFIDEAYRCGSALGPVRVCVCVWDGCGPGRLPVLCVLKRRWGEALEDGGGG